MTWTRVLGAYLSAVLLLSQTTICQQTSTPPIQPQVLLQRSLAALVGNIGVGDVTLSGTIERFAGSDDESGTVTLKALATGESRLDFNFPSGLRTEILTDSDSGPVGSWSDADGTPHAISQHNLWTQFSWFFPIFILNRALTGTDSVVEYVGHETRNDKPVEHIAASRRFQTSGAPAAWDPARLQNLTRIDLYLDSSSLLPAAISFNTHPDRNEAVNIATDIQFSDYRQAAGILIPFHIQKFINGGLALDIRLESATLNSGLTNASIAAQ